MNSWLIHLEFNLKTEFQGLLADRIVDGTKIGSIATLQGPYKVTFGHLRKPGFQDSNSGVR